MRMNTLLALLILSILGGEAVAAESAAEPDSVIVLGALHALHAREQSFDHDRLRRAIVAFSPDILVLEVRPDELAERADTPGRPEYPAILWPLLATSGAQAVAMEPGGALFASLASAAGQAFASLRERDPEGSAALSALDDAVERSLLAYWETASQTQDATTRQMVEALRQMQAVLAGPAFDEVQDRWDAHMASRVAETVRANPGKRILVLASYRNRHLLETAIHDVAAQRLGNAEHYLAAEQLR